MTDTANAPERIWAFHAGPMVGLFIGKKEVGTNVSEYVLATHCDELVAAARAEGAREAQAKLDELRSDRPFIVGWNEGFAEAEYQQAHGKPSDGDLSPQYQHTAKEVAEAQAKIARLTEALMPFSDMAGEMFARNWDASRLVIALDNPEQINRVYVTDFFAARKAIQENTDG